MTAVTTLPHLFETSADRFSRNVFLMEKRHAGYEGTIYGDSARLHRFAAG